MAHQAVTGLFVRLDPVLVTQSGELLPERVEDGMVVVQGTEANNQTLTEVEDLFSRVLDVLQQRPSAQSAGYPVQGGAQALVCGDGSALLARSRRSEGPR